MFVGSLATSLPGGGGGGRLGNMDPGEPSREIFVDGGLLGIS